MDNNSEVKDFESDQYSLIFNLLVDIDKKLFDIKKFYVAIITSLVSLYLYLAFKLFVIKATSEVILLGNKQLFYIFSIIFGYFLLRITSLWINDTLVKIKEESIYIHILESFEKKLSFKPISIVNFHKTAKFNFIYFMSKRGVFERFIDIIFIIFTASMIFFLKAPYYLKFILFFLTFGDLTNNFLFFKKEFMQRNNMKKWAEGVIDSIPESENIMKNLKERTKELKQLIECNNCEICDKRNKQSTLLKNADEILEKAKKVINFYKDLFISNPKLEKELEELVLFREKLINKDCSNKNVEINERTE